MRIELDTSSSKWVVIILVEITGSSLGVLSLAEDMRPGFFSYSETNI